MFYFNYVDFAISELLNSKNFIIIISIIKLTLNNIFKKTGYHSHLKYSFLRLIFKIVLFNSEKYFHVQYLFLYVHSHK